MSGPHEALDRLREAATTGELRDLARRYDVSLIVAFGSAVRPDSTPNDLDIAVRFETDHPDFLEFLNELSELAGPAEIDLMNLNWAGPVAQEQALVKGIKLLECKPGLFANMQMAAMLERMDTAWLRRLDLEQMARG